MPRVPFRCTAAVAARNAERAVTIQHRATPCQYNETPGIGESVSRTPSDSPELNISPGLRTISDDSAPANRGVMLTSGRCPVPQSGWPCVRIRTGRPALCRLQERGFLALLRRRTDLPLRP